LWKTANAKCVKCGKKCDMVDGKFYRQCSKCKSKSTHRQRKYIENLKHIKKCVTCNNICDVIDTKTGKYHTQCGNCKERISVERKKKYELLKQSSKCGKCHGPSEINSKTGKYYVFCKDCKAYRKNIKKNTKKDADFWKICEHDVKFNIETQRYEDCKICASTTY
jgi:hypothetical protein